MPERYRRFTQILGPVNANSSAEFNIVIANDIINIMKVKVVPSILGGSAIYQMYDRDTFAATSFIYGTHAIVGIWDDPVTLDDTGNTVASESVMMFLVPYYDRDESTELHFKVTNRDSQAKSFELTIVYEVPTIVTV